MSDVLSALVPSELDKAAEALIQETESEFKTTGLDDEIAAVPDAGAGDGAVVEAQPDDAGATPGETEPPAPDAPKPDSKPDAGMERLVAREVALLQREEAIKAREAQWAELEEHMKKLQARAMPEDLVTQMELEPDAVIAQLGLDPEQVVRKVIAKRLEAQGKEVPQKLRDEIRQAEKDISYRRELQAIRAEREQEKREQAARTFFEQVQTGAREYVTKGVSEHSPTVALVAKQDPNRVLHEIMEEISRDAQMKAARDPNAPLLTYEEAAKRVETRWSSLRKVFVPENASTPAKPETPNTPAAGAKNGPPAKTPVVKAPDKPLAPWLQKEMTDEDALKAALMEFRRIEKGGA